MKFAFFYPAKLIMGERHIGARIVSKEIVSFDEKNVYFDSQRNMVAFTSCAENHYFLKVGDYVTPIRHFENDETCVKWTSQVAGYSEYKQKAENYIKNPEEYNELCRVNLEKRKAERELSDKEQKEREERRAAASEKEVIKARDTFKAGGMISWNHFEELCNRHAIAIPIQTLGWGRKSVDEISITSLSGRYKTISKQIAYVASQLKGSL